MKDILAALNQHNVHWPEFIAVQKFYWRTHFNCRHDQANQQPAVVASEPEQFLPGSSPILATPDSSSIVAPLNSCYVVASTNYSPVIVSHMEETNINYDAIVGLLSLPEKKSVQLIEHTKVVVFYVIFQAMMKKLANAK